MKCFTYSACLYLTCIPWTTSNHFLLVVEEPSPSSLRPWSVWRSSPIKPNFRCLVADGSNITPHSVPKIQSEQIEICRAFSSWCEPLFRCLAIIWHLKTSIIAKSTEFGHPHVVNDNHLIISEIAAEIEMQMQEWNIFFPQCYGSR